MPPKLRLAYFAHTLRSDWNNGNAHFLRGLLRALRSVGHDITAYEPAAEWSIDNLRSEAHGEQSLDQFLEVYSELDVQTYDPSEITSPASEELWLERLRGTQVVILHEWNPPALATLLLRLRERLGFALLFHDTHHRASSSPESFAELGLARFDGVLAFGDVLRCMYRERFGVEHVWTLHEAADTTVFHSFPEIERQKELVWIGNWGEGERSEEIRNFLLKPAAALLGSDELAAATIYGVRYPAEGLAALQAAGVRYGGYRPNLQAPDTYARAALTVHIPRQQYSQGMTGIPTIRVFEALACGIPLLSAPWQDTEQLFRPGDFLWVHSTAETTEAMCVLLSDKAAAEDQAARGLETVLARHTCDHPDELEFRNVQGHYRMKIFAFGSSIVSSYWNGAATYYRGCYKYLARLGYDITFAEPDAYGRQQHRDSDDFSYVKSLVYQPHIDQHGRDNGSADLDRMFELAKQADVVVKHSGIGVDDAELERRVPAELSAHAMTFIWDVDSPATIHRMRSNLQHDSLALSCSGFDGILSYGGGPKARDGFLEFGARSYYSMYNGLDPETHFPVAPDPPARPRSPRGGALPSRRDARTGPDIPARRRRLA